MPTAAIYTRISQDTEGQALGVARQEEDCRALATRLGLDVVQVYTDNDFGASNQSRKKVRPAYSAMLAAAEAGEFTTILAYSSSRLTRRLMELEGLIALHEATGVVIQTVASGDDDLSTADGQMVARIKAAVDAGEAHRTSERIARKHLELARSGRPVGGTRPYGWQADKATIEPDEAAALRRAASDVIDGVTPTTVVRRMNADGLRTPMDNDWDAKVLRAVLINPRIAGWRVHQGKVALDAAGAPVRGLWEPILDQGTFDAVRAALTRDDSRARTPRKGARHYLLTGLLRCGRCNGTMYGNRNQWGHAYRCDGECNNSSAGPGTDAVVAAMVVGRLAEERLDAPTTAPDSGTEARLDGIAAQIKELMDAYTSKQLSAAVAFGGVETLEKERAALVRQREKVAATRLGPRITHLTPEAWAALDTDRQRAIAEQVLSAVLLRPATMRSNRFDPTRVEPVWRQA